MRRFLLALPVLAACGATPEGDVADSDVGAAVVGSCAYVNTFSQGDECKEYVGAGWTEATAATDCQAPLVGADPGVFAAGVACDRADTLGDCRVGEGTDDATTVVSAGTDAGDCAGAELGCGFADGTFVPSPVCDGSGGGGGGTSGAFPTFELVCVDPVGDEPPGEGPDGQVCTWGAISACTEEGRHFEDYASCDVVVRQRPYYPSPVTYDTPSDDPRFQDEAYLGELAWVTDQVEACGCICCHSDLAPRGSSDWTLDAGPMWIDTVGDVGLAVLAGWVDSSAFGAFPPEDNHGFDRSTTGLPTTDVARMLGFLEGELARRGKTKGDFADVRPFGGPLYDQLHYEPSACTRGEGVAADGTLTWVGGEARYLYVLEQGSDSPGVPPNLDTPDGTLWRVDVPASAPEGIYAATYGVTPAGTIQKVPASGTAPSLVSGRTYYLVVLKDVYQPLTRCLFTAP